MGMRSLVVILLTPCLVPRYDVFRHRRDVLFGMCTPKSFFFYLLCVPCFGQKCSAINVLLALALNSMSDPVADHLATLYSTSKVSASAKSVIF